MAEGRRETETEIAGAGEKKKVMAQAIRSSRLRRVAMGGVCPQPESQVKPPGKLLKSREHPASLTKMCIYRCK